MCTRQRWLIFTGEMTEVCLCMPDTAAAAAASADVSASDSFTVAVVFMPAASPCDKPASDRAICDDPLDICDTPTTCHAAMKDGNKPRGGTAHLQHVTAASHYWRAAGVCTFIVPVQTQRIMCTAILFYETLSSRKEILQMLSWQINL